MLATEISDRGMSHHMKFCKMITKVGKGVARQKMVPKWRPGWKFCLDPSLDLVAERLR
jgi:hypothetical protein